jgi:hypothetical protein
MRLTITAVEDKVVPITTKEVSPEHPSSHVVSATVQIDNQQYLFAITGVPFQHIATISTIVPTLEKLVAIQSNQYALPQYITFSVEKFTFLPITTTGSARALYNLLADVIAKGSSKIEALLISDQIKPYQYGYWTKGGLEYLIDIFPQIQPMHFPYLTKLQVIIVPNSENVLSGLNHIIKKECLPHLKTFELHYSSKCQPRIDSNGWVCSDNIREISQLRELYVSGLGKGSLTFTHKKFTELEHLRLILWTERTTFSGLDTLSRLYRNLKTLVIDSVMPTAKIDELDQAISETMLDKQNSHPSAHNTAHTYYTSTYLQALIAPEDEDLLSVDIILKSQAEISQLEYLEIYHWIPGNNCPIFAHEKLQLYIANDWLPNLRGIIMRPAIDQPFLNEQLINPDTGMDTSGLLAILIEKQILITTLQLLMPEKTGYQAWLAYMAEGGFPQLTHLSYRLPDQLSSETEGMYYSRVKQSLFTLYKVVENIQLEVCTLEGNIPAQFEFIVHSIEERLVNRQASPILNDA